MNNIDSEPTKTLVVLLHGIARTYRSMRRLENALKAEGYSTLNIDYSSRKQDLLASVSDIYQQLHAIYHQPDLKLHFITHSMGGLIVRQLLATYPILHIGRIVMLAPPNQGSEVADFLKNNFLYQWFYGPAGQALTTMAAKTDPLPIIDAPAELAIIAGNRCLDPICYFILPSENDGKVTIESTKLSGMKDHIILPVTHSFLMYNKQVIHQAIYFLKYGRFDI